MRSSVLLTEGDTAAVIDTGPEFRLQMLRERVMSLDAVFYTHDHADHLNGIDDLRVFSAARALPVYGPEDALSGIRHRFDYIFSSDIPGGGKPTLDLRPIRGGRVDLFDIPVIPVPVMHGKRLIYGYRIGDMAYLTDCSGIPAGSMDLLRGVSLLVIGALRFRPHPTHFSVDQAVEAAGRIGAEEVYLTHVCHEIEYEEVSAMLPAHVHLAYDGLKLKIPEGKNDHDKRV